MRNGVVRLGRGLLGDRCLLLREGREEEVGREAEMEKIMLVGLRR